MVENGGVGIIYEIPGTLSVGGELLSQGQG
jgi:hypothetical protein